MCGDGSQEILDATCGIVFLGTPHQGSPISFVGFLFSLITGFLGSDGTLLLSMRNHDLSLRNLINRFDQRISDRRMLIRQPFRIVSFHEEKYTFLFGWLCIGHVGGSIVTTIGSEKEADIYPDCDINFSNGACRSK